MSVKITYDLVKFIKIIKKLKLKIDKVKLKDNDKDNLKIVNDFIKEVELIKIKGEQLKEELIKIDNSKLNTQKNILVNELNNLSNLLNKLVEFKNYAIKRIEFKNAEFVNKDFKKGGLE